MGNVLLSEDKVAAIASPGQVVLLDVPHQATPRQIDTAQQQLDHLHEKTGVHFVMLVGGIRVARITTPEGSD